MINTVAITAKHDKQREADYERWLEHCDRMGVSRGFVGSTLGRAIYTAGWSAAYARMQYVERRIDTFVGVFLMTWVGVMIVAVCLFIWWLIKALS